MYTNSYITVNPNLSNDIRNINTLVQTSSVNGKKKPKVTRQTMSNVHNNYKTHSLNDNFGGAF